VNTVVLEVQSLSETLADAARAMKTGRSEGEARNGRIEFPFDAVKVEFLLRAA
jgi:hypothetical protein